MTLLQVRNLTVRFGGLTALDDVNLDVEEGSFVGLIGPNGAGKTTLMDAVTGLVRSTGSIIFDGTQLSGLPPHKRIRAGLGRTFQSLELFEDLTVRENLTIAAERAHWWSAVSDLVRPRSSKAATTAVDRALSLLGIERLSESLPTGLSLGERKLVSIARCVAAEPRLLLLDEPAAGLDSDEGLALGQDLCELVRAGITILMIDHDMGLVLGVCSHVKVLDFGRLIAEGTPAEIRGNERVIHAYLGAGAEEPAVGGEPPLVEGRDTASKR
jgi:ABC-type branched-subunit amino acid transport system ATPase component